jgi:hypothetical protein
MMEIHLFQDLFKPFSILMARETTLGGNQWLSESHRLEWLSESNYIDSPLEDDVYLSLSTKEDGDTLDITLVPMQIRTFIIDIQIIEQ